MGLPQDASIETVTIGPSSDTAGFGTTKTRVVRCPQNHRVAVTFSVTVPHPSKR